MKISLSKLISILDPSWVPTWLHFATQNRPENRSRRLSKASPGILGRSWPLLNRPWSLLQRPWALFCRLMALLCRSWPLLDDFGSIFGSNLGVPGGSANRVFGNFFGYGTHLAPRPPPSASRTFKNYHFRRFSVPSRPSKSQFLMIWGGSRLTQNHDFS